MRIISIILFSLNALCNCEKPLMPCASGYYRDEISICNKCKENCDVLFEETKVRLLSDCREYCKDDNTISAGVIVSITVLIFILILIGIATPFLVDFIRFRYYKKKPICCRYMPDYLVKKFFTSNQGNEDQVYYEVIPSNGLTIRSSEFYSHYLDLPPEPDYAECSMLDNYDMVLPPEPDYTGCSRRLYYEMGSRDLDGGQNSEQDDIYMVPVRVGDDKRNQERNGSNTQIQVNRNNDGNRELEPNANQMNV